MSGIIHIVALFFSLLAAYAHDNQRPFPGYTNGRRIEHYFYDGSRRVQEVFHDPVASSADSEEESSEGEVTDWVYTPYVASEYVHSPFYVDEQVAQFTTPYLTRPWFPLRDANYNIVGLVDDTGDVRLQRSFTPYGELLWEETFVSGSGPSGLPRVRAGHQGLFFDRLDGFYASTPIATASKGLYHNRNRSYSPHLGRFVQADPNATGLVTAGIIDSRQLAMHAATPSIETLLDDGYSVHIGYSSNPITMKDPLGLYSDPFDDVAAFAIEHLFSGLDGIGRAMSRAKLGLRQVQAYEKAGWEWAQSIIDQTEDILLSVVLGPFMATACFSEGTEVQLLSGPCEIEHVSLGRAVAEVNGDIADVVLADTSWYVVRLEFKNERDGSVTSAELLRPAEWILHTRFLLNTDVPVWLSGMDTHGYARLMGVDPFSGNIDQGHSVVTGRFVTTHAYAADLYLEGHPSPIGVTAGHKFYSVDRKEWVAAGDLYVGELLLGLNGTVRMERLSPRVKAGAVYNIEVSGSRSYCVGDAKVLAHNTCAGAVQEMIKKSSSPNYTGKVFNAVRGGGWTQAADDFALLARQAGGKVTTYSNGVKTTALSANVNATLYKATSTQGPSIELF